MTSIWIHQSKNNTSMKTQTHEINETCSTKTSRKSRPNQCIQKVFRGTRGRTKNHSSILERSTEGSKMESGGSKSKMTSNEVPKGSKSKMASDGNRWQLDREGSKSKMATDGNRWQLAYAIKGSRWHLATIAVGVATAAVENATVVARDVASGVFIKQFLFAKTFTCLYT